MFTFETLSHAKRDLSAVTVTSWRAVTWKGLILKTTVHPGTFIFGFTYFNQVLELAQSVTVRTCFLTGNHSSKCVEKIFTNSWEDLYFEGLPLLSPPLFHRLHLPLHLFLLFFLLLLLLLPLSVIFFFLLLPSLLHHTAPFSSSSLLFSPPFDFQSLLPASFLPISSSNYHLPPPPPPYPITLALLLFLLPQSPLYPPCIPFITFVFASPLNFLLIISHPSPPFFPLLHFLTAFPHLYSSFFYFPNHILFTRCLLLLPLVIPIFFPINRFYFTYFPNLSSHVLFSLLYLSSLTFTPLSFPAHHPTSSPLQPLFHYFLPLFFLPPVLFPMYLVSSPSHSQPPPLSVSAPPSFSSITSSSSSFLHCPVFLVNESVSSVTFWLNCEICLASRFASVRRAAN